MDVSTYALTMTVVTQYNDNRNDVTPINAKMFLSSSEYDHEYGLGPLNIMSVLYSLFII